MLTGMWQGRYKTQKRIVRRRDVGLAVSVSGWIQNSKENCKPHASPHSTCTLWYTDKTQKRIVSNQHIVSYKHILLCEQQNSKENCKVMTPVGGDIRVIVQNSKENCKPYS